MTDIPLYTRKDGRQASELRGKELKLSEASQFDGSSRYAQGLTSVAVTVHGPTLAKQENYRECDVAVRVLNAFEEHPMAGGADRLGQKERRRIQANKRDAYQLEMLVERCVHAIFLRERFPRCVLVIDVLIYHDAGSLAAVVVNAVMTALLDAGVPCRTTMAAVSLALVETTATSSSSSLPTSSPPQRDFILDPTDMEEKLLVEEIHHGTTRTGEKRGRESGPSASSPSQATSSSPSSGAAAADKLIVRRQTIACGTFVVSNPNCGGGLLATHVQRAAARPAVDARTGGQEGTTTTDASSTKPASVTLGELLEMTKLAERAALFVFDLFRQCNVPLSS